MGDFSELAGDFVQHLRTSPEEASDASYLQTGIITNPNRPFSNLPSSFLLDIVRYGQMMNENGTKYDLSSVNLMIASHIVEGKVITNLSSLSGKTRFEVS